MVPYIDPPLAVLAVAGHALLVVERLALGDAAFAFGQAFAVRGADVDVPGGDVGLADRLAVTRLWGCGLAVGRTASSMRCNHSGERAGGKVTQQHFSPPRSWLTDHGKTPL